MSSSNNRSRALVWSVFGHLLGQQVRQACSLSNPTIDMDDDDLADILDNLIVNLAHGGRKKQLYGTIAPCLETPQQHAVFSEFSNWIFSTQGVLSALYQPLLSDYAAVEEQNNLQGIVVQVTEFPRPSEHTQPIPQDSDLLRLPIELLDIVLTSLPPQDVNDLRLTCRQAEMITFPFWSKAFFSTRQFMIDEYSLQILMDISLHPQLSKVLTHLIVGVDEIDTKDTLPYIRASRAKNPSTLPSLFQYWRDAAAAQQALLNTGRAIDLLSSAMSHLPNLDKVSVSGSKPFAHASYDSNILHYPDLGMRSYGSSAYQMQPRHTTTGTPNSKGFIDRVFNVVLNSLVRSTTRISSLRTYLSRDDTLDHLDDEAFNLLPLAHIQDSAAIVLGGLSELHLDVSLESQLLEKVSHPSDHDHTFDTSEIGLQLLLGMTCKLDRLSLNFFGGETMEGHCDFTAWLSAPAGRPPKADSKTYSPIAWNPPPIALPFLRSLELKGLFISVNQLRAIFTKFYGLKSAALDGVYLRHCFLDESPVAEHSGEMENLWASFFRGSTAALAKLEILDLDNLATMQYREDPEEGITVTSKDVDLVVFDPEEGSTGPPASFKTVTKFGKGDLRKLARETRLGRDVLATADITE